MMGEGVEENIIDLWFEFYFWSFFWSFSCYYNCFKYCFFGDVLGKKKMFIEEFYDEFSFCYSCSRFDYWFGSVVNVFDLLY